MKKTTSLIVMSLVGGMAMAQSNNNKLEPTFTKAELSSDVKKSAPAGYISSEDRSEAIIWSEDFASGIPAGWVNQGYDGSLSPLANAVWEYRGPSTTPSNGTGSRGAFANANDPIVSPTASNGFVIFDSDYLDNGGISTNMGNGPAPAPHVGTLTTGVINLTGHPDVELVLTQYARVFYANFQIAFSTNGGTTWSDTVTVQDNVSLGVNQATPNNDLVELNVSSIVGNQSNVKMRFIFDGRPGNANGNAYYFWMIDDIILRDLPSHKFKFVAGPGGAPAHDIIYNGDGLSGRYGVMALKQNRTISFDSNFLNYGSATQTNAKLEVDIIDNNSGNLLTTLSSSTASSVASGSIVDYTVAFTPNWTPPNSVTSYDIVYRAVSDSISATNGEMPTDTFTIYVTDSLHSLDFNIFSNRFGTANIGADNSEIGVRHDLVQDERAFGAWVRLSAATVPGGLIEFELYDTTGFDYVAGFPTNALVSVQHTITSADSLRGFVRVDFTDNNGNPLYLDKDSYYLTMRMFSNAGANNIAVANDQTFAQASAAAIMYYTLASPNRWYTGFSNSLTLNAPWMRLIVCPASNAAACMALSVEEVAAEMEIVVGQDVANNTVVINFNQVLGGNYDILMTDIKGSVMVDRTVVASNGHQEVIDASELPVGVYLLTVKGEQGLNTYKVMVQ